MKLAALKYLLFGLIIFSLAGCGSIPSGVTNFFMPAVSKKDSTRPAPTTLRATVEKEVGVMWIFAVLLACGAGACAYFQNYLCAVKLGLAAVALGVGATLWLIFWAWIIAGALVALAAYVFIHYKAVILPAANEAAATLKKT
jgi:hypothetical protein